MPSFEKRNITTTTFEWRVTGLSSPWNHDNYAFIGLYTGSTTNGSTTAPSGHFDSIYPDVTGTNYYTPWTDKTGLTPGTTYNFNVYAKSQSDQYWFITSTSVTTLSAIPQTPSDPILPSEGYRYEGGFRVEWSAETGATSYDLELERIYDGYTVIYNTTNTYYSFSADTLEYGVKYGVRVRAKNSYGSSAYSGQNLVTTRPKKPTLTAQNITATSMEIKITGLVDNYTEVRVTICNSSGVSLGVTKYGGNNSVLLFDGLVANTTYTFRGFTELDVNDDGVSDIDSRENYYQPGATLARPANFAWTYAKTSGGTFRITDTEWNNFTAKINQFRAYKNLSAYSFTTAYNGNNFTATMFNQARNALYDLRSYFTGGYTIPSTKSTGDIVYASYLNDMKNAMNSIL